MAGSLSWLPSSHHSFFSRPPPPPPAATRPTPPTTTLLPLPYTSTTATPPSAPLLPLPPHGSPSLASALQHCSAALCPRGTAQLHARILRLGRSDDSYLTSKLLHFYASSGQLATALSLLRLTPRHLLTPFFYNVLIRTHTDFSLHETAVNLFSEMLASGLSPNEFTFPFVLKSCSALGLLELGRQIHSLLIKAGILDQNVFSTTALLDVYAKWGCFGDACQLFERIPSRNVVAWNSILSSYVQNGFFQEALEMLETMEEELREGVGQSSWNSIIAGCVRRDDVGSALDVLTMMVRSIKPNAAAFNTLLPVIPDITPAIRLKELHGYVMRHVGLIDMDCIDDERLRSAVASGYAYNGFMGYASHLFEVVDLRNCQLWNAMISGFFDTGNISEALEVFRDMATLYGQELRALSKASMTLVLSECNSESKHGLEIHAYAYRHGLNTYTSISNALIAMYNKRGDITLPKRVFEMTAEKDIITWNTMVSSYALVRDFGRAFLIFHQMLSEGIRPDEFSFGSVLDGCGHTSSLLQGMALHCQIIKGGFSCSFCVIQNALVDMYGKCGCIEDARKVFDEMELKDGISWNTIISCYAFNACPNEAFSLFNKMKEEGWKPNRVTFIGLLSACSHAGLLDESFYYFESMIRNHGIVPDVNHYTCIVDNLGRAGQLDRAYQLIQSMPVEPDDCIWGALLSGCRIHGNIELAEVAANHLIELEPMHSGYRVLLSNIYADASRWNNVAQVWAAMKDDGVKKYPGYSWIELGDGVHRFFTADKTQRQCSDIYFALDGLMKQLRDEGYVPSTNYGFISSVRLG